MFASKDLFFSKPSGYQISRSVRLRSSASAYFNRTPASAGNRKTWTWSGWVKRGALPTSGYYSIFGADSGSGQSFYVAFDNSTQQLEIGQGATVNRKTTQVFRDPSAWYHLVVQSDTTQATASNRLRVYVNGLQVTAFATSNDPSLNGDWALNNNVAHTIGADITNIGARNFFDGYLTEINFIDGQALTPSSFGETDTLTGVWKPKKYAGTYGTNGFYLNFSDNSNNTATTIGKDYSGNGNNWTPNNISVTAGVTYDSMLDVPTLYADGGNGRGNYATWNPLGDSVGNAPITLSNANLTATNGAASYLGALGTIALPSSGKYYWEGQLTSTSSGSNIWTFGIAPSNIPLTGNQTNFSGSSSWYIGSNEQIQPNGVATSAVAGTTSDVYQICFDAATGNVFLGKNNTFYSSTGAATGNPATGANPSRTLTAGDFGLIPWTFGYAIGGNVNFGQRPFTYTPPTGFVALNTQNLPTPTISNGANYMAATLYTGNNTGQTITNTVNSASFQPDFLWIKVRSNTYGHSLADSVRGVSASLESNSTAAEVTNSELTSFNSNGFTLGATGSLARNVSGQTYVAWQWKAGGTAVSNTSGSITSTVSVGATQGFSVVTYTGNGTNGATFGHGLGVAPSMVIGRCRSTTEDWPVYHVSLSAGNNLRLNSTQAQFTYSSTTSGGIASASSTIVTTGQGVTTNGSMNASGATYVAYCFAPVAGYSAFGKYTGNGSADGPFVYCGFRPRFVMLKNISLADTAWIIYDNQRNGFNETEQVLNPNSSIAETTYTTTGVDMLSNGFKLRGTSSWHGSSGQTVIFAAFAENPTKFSLAR